MIPRSLLIRRGHVGYCGCVEHVFGCAGALPLSFIAIVASSDIQIDQKRKQRLGSDLSCGHRCERTGRRIKSIAFGCSFARAVSFSASGGCHHVEVPVSGAGLTIEAVEERSVAVIIKAGVQANSVEFAELPKLHSDIFANAPSDVGRPGGGEAADNCARLSSPGQGSGVRAES
ncbi:hypothetical protein [Bradyrhizobium canariense]|uniref:hypothetical protein n=1 Tax=Bradyrhizobium canariense TaxID=255045 RepID=UPI00142FAC99|nr:hypothetical protein [Bradyrhizobium canariense]